MDWRDIEKETMEKFQHECYKIIKELYRKKIPYETIFTMAYKTVSMALYECEIENVLQGE